MCPHYAGRQTEKNKKKTETYTSKKPRKIITKRRLKEGMNMRKSDK
jgi:hypothetical protein